jgi:hypothetical protein
MTRGLGTLLLAGLVLVVLLASGRRWMAAAGAGGMLLAGAMLYRLVRERSRYLGAGHGLLWLGLGLAGLVLFVWGWL